MVFSIGNSFVPSTHRSFKKKEVSGTLMEQISGIIMVCHDNFFTVLPFTGFGVCQAGNLLRSL